MVKVIKSGRMKWERNVACMWGMRNAYWILVGKPERKRPPERPMCRWENNNKMDFKEIRHEDAGSNGGLLSQEACFVYRPSTTNRWSVGQTTTNSAPQLVIPSPPWKSSSSTTNLPKYSPAFKRKSLTVYGSTSPSREELRPSFLNSRNSAEPPASLESITSPTR